MIFFDLNVIFFQCRFYLLWTSSTSDSEAMVGMKRHPVTSQTPLFCWAAADLKVYWTGHGHHKQRNLLFVGCNLKSHPKYWIWYDLLFLKHNWIFFSSTTVWCMSFEPNILKILKNFPKAKATIDIDQYLIRIPESKMVWSISNCGIDTKTIVSWPTLVQLQHTFSQSNQTMIFLKFYYC